MQENLAVQLGFDSPEFLGADLPAEIDGRSISEELSKSVTAIVDSGFEASSRSFSLRVIAHCGKGLLKANRPKEALHLVSHAIARYQNRPAIALIELKALKAVGRIRQLAERTTELLKDPKVDGIAATKYFTLLRQVNLHHTVNGSSEKFQSFFGDIEKYIDDPLAQTEKLVRESVYDADRACERVMQLRGLTIASEKDEFMFRWHVGQELFALAKFVLTSRAKIARLDQSAQLTSKDSKINALGIKLHSLISAQSQVRIANAIAAAGPNRSLVLALSHSGVSLPIVLPKENFPIPVSVVTNGAINSPSDPSFHLRTGAESTVRDFAKLVKLSRREPRVVRIFPDGPEGEQFPTTLFGKAFQIGRGASTLAYLCRAKTFFGAYELCNQEFDFVLNEGPDPEAYGEMALFERAFADFYAGCLERILLGPPENIGMGASFWRVHLS